MPACGNSHGARPTTRAREDMYEDVLAGRKLEPSLLPLVVAGCSQQLEATGND